MSSLPPPIPNKDDDHLNLLATFHYIVGGLGALFACFPLIHVFIGMMMILQPEFMAGKEGSAPPAFMGFLFAGIGIVFVLLGWAAAICTIVSGRMLARRRHRMFSFVMAAFLCMFMPFGTVLGIFTIIVLSRESVRRLYGETV